MSGETEKQVSGWTVDTLKEHHDDHLGFLQKLSEERDKRYHERWQAQEAATKYNQEKSNEFRGALDDLSTKQATKVEVATAVNTLGEKIESVNKEVSGLRSRLDVGNPDIRLLQNQQAINSGITQGSVITMGKIYAVIAAVGAILGMIVLLANGVFK